MDASLGGLNHGQGRYVQRIANRWQAQWAEGLISEKIRPCDDMNLLGIVLHTMSEGSLQRQEDSQKHPLSTQGVFGCGPKTILETLKGRLCPFFRGLLPTPLVQGQVEMTSKGDATGGCDTEPPPAHLPASFAVTWKQPRLPKGGRGRAKRVPAGPAPADQWICPYHSIRDQPSPG